MRPRAPDYIATISTSIVTAVAIGEGASSSRGRWALYPYIYIYIVVGQSGISVGGNAMYMKWLDEIWLGSWEWENPTPERAIQRPAWPVLTGHAIGCPLAGGSG